VISRKAIREFAEKYPDAFAPMDSWYRRATKAHWANLADVKADYPHADLVGICTVFNIKGSDYRLITKIYYNLQKIYIRHILTHKEYDKGRWKDDCGC
jgi:mRNA interferase HigB